MYRCQTTRLSNSFFHDSVHGLLRDRAGRHRLSDDHEHDECPGAPTIDSFIVTPTSVAAGGTVNAMGKVSNYTIGHSGEHSCPHGHPHIYLDDLQVNPLSMPMMASSTVTIPAGTSAGKHQLIARLHAEDHQIIKPEVTASVDIEVK